MTETPKCRKCGRSFSGTLYQIAMEGGDASNYCECDKDRIEHQWKVESLLESILETLQQMNNRDSGI